MSGVILACLAVLCTAVLKILFQRSAAAAVPAVVLFAICNIGSFALLAVILPQPNLSALSLEDISLLLVNICAWLAVGFLDYSAYKSLAVSSVEVFKTVSLLLVAFFSTIFFSENIGLLGMLGLALVVVSSLIEGKLNISQIRALFLSFLSAIFLALAFLTEKALTNSVPIVTIVLVGTLIPGLILIAVKPSSLRQYSAGLVLRSKAIIPIVVLSALSYYFWILACAKCDLTLIVILANSCAICVLFLESLLSWKLNPILQRWKSCLLCLCGVVIFAIG